MTNKAAILFAALTVGGCSTTIREMADNHPPRAVYHSTKSEAALEQCLGERMSWLGAPSILHGETSTEIAFGGGGTTAVLVTLRRGTADSTVEVRQLLTYGARVKHNVESCI